MSERIFFHTLPPTESEDIILGWARYSKTECRMYTNKKCPQMQHAGGIKGILGIRIKNKSADQKIDCSGCSFALQDHQRLQGLGANVEFYTRTEGDSLKSHVGLIIPETPNRSSKRLDITIIHQARNVTLI